MSIYHSDMEHEQKQAEPSIFTQETVPGQVSLPTPPSLPPTRPTSRRWLAVLVSVLIVLVLATTVGAIVLTRPGQKSATQTPTPNPTTSPAPTSTTRPTTTPTTLPVGQWVQVLTGYHVTELSAAPGHPDVLYACAIAPGVPVQYRSVQTVLRSADAGATWQDIGKRAQMSRGCELVVNPTDSYEVYVATDANPPTSTTVSSYVLEHTSNGGDSWETIHPTVEVPGLNTALAWQGTQLSFAGNRLYSLQALPISSTPTPQGPGGWYPTLLSRLITSTDGGYSWQVLDTRLAVSGLTATAYTVNSVHPAIVYELTLVPVEPGTGFPPMELYQSANDGQTWQSVLRQIPNPGGPPSIQILTGSENADVVYLTNTRCPATQAFHAGSGPLAKPFAGSPYSVCMSSDAGKSWRTVLAPSQFAQTIGGGVIDQQGRLYAQTPLSGAAEIWRYDPAAATWSKVTQAPQEGSVLAATPTGAHATTVLWLMTTNGQVALYRYII